MLTFTVLAVSVMAVIGFFKWRRAIQDPLTLMANNNQKMWVENHKSELGLDKFYDDDDFLEEETETFSYSYSYVNTNPEVREDNYLFEHCDFGFNDFTKNDF
jgi:hypothetical protein